MNRVGAETTSETSMGPTPNGVVVAPAVPPPGSTFEPNPVVGMTLPKLMEVIFTVLSRGSAAKHCTGPISPTFLGTIFSPK